MVLIAGIVVLAGSAVVYMGFHRPGNVREVTRAEARTKDPVAELVSATGMVLAGKPGRTEWTQMAIGARLMEGDLVQTAKAGAAGIRYSNGNTVTIQENTVLTIRSAGDGSMEISVPTMGAEPVPSAPGKGQEAKPVGLEDRNAVAAFNEVRAGEPGPFIRLDRVIPFGRSLELVGKVEAGSRLSVNNEIVDVGGDGSFKHFTNPFPASDQKVNLLMRVTDLAGRTRAIAASHDFNPQRRDH